jgi:hypothetical protein
MSSSFFILTRLFNRYFVRRVVRISEGIGMIESGSYPVDIHIDEDDEALAHSR